MSRAGDDIPRIGVAAVVTHRQRILLGRRLKAPMPGSWQLPGGWLGYRETPQQAVQRRLVPFAGMSCSAPRFVAMTNNLFADGTHTVSLYYQLRCLNADELELGSNQQCSDWFWGDWYDLPEPLFLPLARLQEGGFEPLDED